MEKTKFVTKVHHGTTLKYLDNHPFLTVREYRRITGLLQTAATNELRQWAHQPESGIGIDGIGSHRVYIKRNQQDSGDR